MADIIEHQIDSYHAYTLTDGEHALTLIPEKGSDIVSLRHIPSDTEFLWTTPNGLRRDTPSKSFIDNYEGGWQELFPTGGPPLMFRGAEMPKHGEVFSLAWNVVATEATRDRASITLEVKTVRSPFHIKKTITLHAGTGMIEIDETATNRGEEDLPVMWGHHPAFGGNFLDGSCKIDAPARRVWSYALPENELTGQFEVNVSGEWPLLKNKRGQMVDVSEIAPPTARTADMLFIGDFEDDWFAITNRDKKVGVALLFDRTVFPLFWYWRMLGGGTGYPWYGRAYAVALEPFTTAPDPAVTDIAHLKNTLIIPAHESANVRLRVLMYKGIKGVGRISPDGVIVPRI